MFKNYLALLRVVILDHDIQHSIVSIICDLDLDFGTRRGLLSGSIVCGGLRIRIQEHNDW